MRIQGQTQITEKEMFLAMQENYLRTENSTMEACEILYQSFYEKGVSEEELNTTVQKLDSKLDILRTWLHFNDPSREMELCVNCKQAIDLNDESYFIHYFSGEARCEMNVYATSSIWGRFRD